MDFMESSMACFTVAASKLRLLIAATFFSKGRLPRQSRMPAAAFMALCPVKLTAACAVVPTQSFIELRLSPASGGRGTHRGAQQYQLARLRVG